MNLASMLQSNNLTQYKAAEILQVDRAMISRVISGTYPHGKEKEKELIDQLVASGYKESETNHIVLNTNVLVPTRSVTDFKNLADDLINPEESLSSSLGMVIGTAERGKTHAARWFVIGQKHASYILYIDGSTKVQVLRDICEQIANTRPFSFDACLQVIKEYCRFTRRLIIVDEADKCPIQILEMIRGLNEQCNLPFLLVGEEGLKTKIDRVPRLRSRIRNPVVVFESITAVDVAVYYSAACHLTLDKNIAEQLARRACGGFRSVVNDSLAIAKISKASGLTTINTAVINQLN